MAQIVVRGIDDELMAQFKEQVRARGKSTEQAVRELIEHSVRANRPRTEWLKEADIFRERLLQQYGESEISAAEMIREDRDSR